MLLQIYHVMVKKSSLIFSNFDIVFSLKKSDNKGRKTDGKKEYT